MDAAIASHALCLCDQWAPLARSSGRAAMLATARRRIERSLAHGDAQSAYAELRQLSTAMRDRAPLERGTLGANEATLDQWISQQTAGDSGIAAAWNRIKQQITSEGPSIAGMSLDQQLQWAGHKLVNGFNEAIDQSTIAAQYPNAVKGAESLVSIGSTVAGSVGHIANLLAHGGGSFQQDAEIATETMGLVIGIAVAASAMTAGVGTAIMGAATVVVDVLDQLFGPPTRDTASICGAMFPGKPDYAIGQSWGVDACCPVYNDSHNGYANPQTGNAVVNKGDAVHWRSFPEPNRQQDYRWFNDGSDDPGDYFWWDGSPGGYGPPSNGGASLKIVGFDRLGWDPKYLGQEWGTTNVHFREYGRVSYAWPVYRTLRWCADNDSLNGFNKAFFTAWKANQEFNINGLTPASDADVLAHVAYHWNHAHSPSQKATFSPIPPSSVGTQDGFYWRSLIAQISGGDLAPSFMQNGNMVLNMGPRLQVIKGGIILRGGKPPATSAAKKAGVVLVGATALSVAAWFALGRPMSLEAIKEALLAL